MGNNFSENLKKWREANCLTQKQVADFLKINRSTYSNYEAGIREMPIELEENVANLLGCSISSLHEEDSKVSERMLATAFRIDELNEKDLEQISRFKSIVKNYIKMNSILDEHYGQNKY